MGEDGDMSDQIEGDREGEYCKSIGKEGVFCGQGKTSQCSIVCLGVDAFPFPQFCRGSYLKMGFLQILGDHSHLTPLFFVAIP